MRTNSSPNNQVKQTAGRVVATEDNMSNPLAPIAGLANMEDSTLSGRTTKELREAIISGKLAPGEKLNEPRLA